MMATTIMSPPPSLPTTTTTTTTSSTTTASCPSPTPAVVAVVPTNTLPTAALTPEEIGYIPDKVKKAEKRISAYPYDTEAWSVLIRDAQMKMIGDARNTYERLVGQFPNAGRYWKSYIEQEVYKSLLYRSDSLHWLAEVPNNT